MEICVDSHIFQCFFGRFTIFIKSKSQELQVEGKFRKRTFLKIFAHFERKYGGISLRDRGYLFGNVQETLFGYFGEIFFFFSNFSKKRFLGGRLSHVFFDVFCFFSKTIFEIGVYLFFQLVTSAQNHRKIISRGIAGIL